MLLRKYKDRAEHDQKLLNIMFHFNPHLLHQLECSWNFKNNFCTDAGNVCQHAEDNGAGAVHGITSAFFGDVNPTFRALYEGNWLPIITTVNVIIQHFLVITGILIYVKLLWIHFDQLLKEELLVLIVVLNIKY